MRRDGQVPQRQEPGSRRARVGGAGQPRRGGQHWLGGAVRLQELVRHQRGSDERRTIMSAIEIVSAFCFWFQKPCWRPRHDFQRYVSVVNASKHRLGCEAPLGTQFRDTGSFQLIVCSTYLCLIIICVTEKLFLQPRKRLVRRNAGPSCRLWIKKICITCSWPGSDYSEGMSPTVFCEWEMYLANYTDPISWRSKKMLSSFSDERFDRLGQGHRYFYLAGSSFHVYFHVYSSGKIV